MKYILPLACVFVLTFVNRQRIANAYKSNPKKFLILFLSGFFIAVMAISFVSVMILLG